MESTGRTGASFSTHITQLATSHESGKSRFLSGLKALKESLESFFNTFKRVLLNRPQMAFHFGQCASVRQVARLLGITEGGARDPVT
jgi:hypothetical protein